MLPVCTFGVMFRSASLPVVIAIVLAPEVHQRDLRRRDRVGGLVEVPAGAGADIEVPAAQVGVVAAQEPLAGAAPGVGVAPLQDEGVVRRQDGAAALLGPVLRWERSLPRAQCITTLSIHASDTVPASPDLNESHIVSPVHDTSRCRGNQTCGYSARRRRGLGRSVRAPCPGLLFAHSTISERFHSGVRPIFSTGAGACPRETYPRNVETERSVPVSSLIRSMT